MSSCMSTWLWRSVRLLRGLKHLQTAAIFFEVRIIIAANFFSELRILDNPWTGVLT